MTARGFYKARVPGTLKAAEAELVAACGGHSEAAHKCRLKKSALQIATDPDSDRHLAIDVVMQLEAACGKPIVTRFLALERNCLVVPFRAPSDEPLSACVARLTTETGQLLTAAARDLAAAKLSRTQAINIIKECGDVASAVSMIHACARLAVEDDHK